MSEQRSIYVERPGASVDQYAPGNRWHIDQHGRLHIIGPGGNIATYRPDAWTSVAFDGARGDR